MADFDPKQVMESFNALKATVESNTITESERKEKLDKVEASLNSFEEHKQKELARNNQLETDHKELKERHNALELQMAKSGAGQSVKYRDSEEYKSLLAYTTQGVTDDHAKKMIIEQKAMRMDDNTAGGALTSVELDNQIIKKIIEMSPVRSIVSVKTTSKKTLEMPTRTGIPTASYEGEAEEGGESASTYGTELLTARRLTVTIPYTEDLLGDSDFDLLAEINGDVSEAFAFKEGQKFVLGNGVTEPEGFTINEAVVAAQTTSETSAVIAADDLITLTGVLKVGYNPMYGFNRTSLATFRKFKGTANDHYIWQAGLAPNVPNTINGEPYVLLQDMADITNSSLSVVYGDFKRGYRWIDRTGLVIIRDDYTSKKKAIVELTYRKYNSGKVINPEAIKLLLTKA